MEKKNYERPLMTVEKFLPQEFCSQCYLGEVHCIGESDSQGHFIRYITFPPDTHEYDMHWNGHTEHPVTYHLRLPDGITPTAENFTTLTEYIIKVDDPQGAATSSDEIEIAHGRSSSGHEQYDGWGWLVNGNVHFTYDPTFRLYTERPNHS